MTVDPKKFLEDLALPVVGELAAIEGIKKFTTNPAGWTPSRLMSSL